jgi:hypothetical protein
MAGKHDDLLFSDMIAQEAGGQQTTKVREEPPPSRPKLLNDLKKGRLKNGT